MKRLGLLLPLLFILLAALPSSATTWYVRTDGGTATQCTGTTNAAYPGTGSGVACAVNHPYWLLNQSTFAWNVVANDTIQFEDVGPYYMGQSNGTVGQTWAYCTGAGAQNCYPATLPSSVRVLGKNAGACHTAGHAPQNPTQLVGINHLYKLWDVRGTNHDDMECLDITQLATCTGQGKTDLTITATSLTGNVATYSWRYPGYDNRLTLGEPISVSGTTNGGGIFNVGNAIITSITNPNASTGTFTIALTHANVTSAAETGTVWFAGYCDAPVSNQSGDFLGTGIMFSDVAGTAGPRNITLKDVFIHGLKNDGIHGSQLNATGTDTFTMSDVILDGNGGEGWNSDNNGCDTNCESTGTMSIQHLQANWNGCVEVHPNGGTIGGNGHNYCVDQAFNGNGDGLVMIATGGTWNWSDIFTEYNAQDGFDSLHTGDDAVTQPTLSLTRIYSVGNEGQSIKGGGSVTLTNSIGIANCNVFATASNFPANPAGWNALVGLTCRANDAMAFGMQGSNSLVIENVTNIGQQNVSWDISNTSCTTGCTVVFKNNTTMGYLQPVFSGYPGGFYWASTFNPLTTAGSSASHNAWYHIGSSGTDCPGDSNETNYVCTDPLFSNETLNTANVQLLSGSPLIRAGVAISGLTTDYAGNTRPNPPAIGAYEPGAVVNPPLNVRVQILGATLY